MVAMRQLNNWTQQWTVLTTDNELASNLAVTDKYGIWHTPRQFLSMAMKVQHPMDAVDHLEDSTRYALDFNFGYPGHLVRLERRQNLLQAKLMALRLTDDEARLHASMPGHLQKVLVGKNLLLWKALLEKYEYDDMGVVPFMMEGVRLVGKHDSPPCYPHMLKPATLTADDLASSSVWRREAIVGRVGTSDPAHVEHLEATALEELDLGFL